MWWLLVVSFLCTTVTGPCEMDGCAQTGDPGESMRVRVCRQGDYVFHEWKALPDGLWQRVHPPGQERYCPRDDWVALWTREIEPTWREAEASGMDVTTRHPFWQLPVCDEEPVS